MAEIDYMEDYGGSASAATGTGVAVGKWANISGAVVSLALIAGLSVWGYKLMMRDVTGVPVVKAMEGAFRVAPDDPGGMRAPHQGLAVNEIAAIGGAGGPANEVQLAPPPMALADEDRPNAVLNRMAGMEADAATPLDEHWDATDQIDSNIAPTDTVADAPQDALATDRAVAEALSLPEADLEVESDEFFLADEAEADATDTNIASLSQARSPRPPQRPERTAASAAPDNIATVASDPMAGLPGEEVSVDDLAKGTRLVQLGAFASADVAREQWDKIAGSFPDYFEGKRRIVQRATSGGKIFYRLRADGFDDLADTRRFCTALVAGSADCIPVELR